MYEEHGQPLVHIWNACNFFLFVFQACATFNFLNSEQRLVCGAFIPPITLRFNENDILRTKLRHNELYTVE